MMHEPPTPFLSPRPSSPRPAFTLIELLVVIAIIALLVGILLPSLAGARNEGRALKCSANLKSVAQGVVTYTIDSDFFPPSYVYAASTIGGEWNFGDQQTTNPNPSHGYVHWSYSLFANGGQVPEEAFRCPAVKNGGAPRTNPGPKQEDWEPGQVSDTGGSSPTQYPEDRQARRMAYTGNATIFPRNKFTQASIRKNILPRVAGVDNSTKGASGTILATEFLQFNGGWDALSSGGLIKSHRPVTPFKGISTTDVYNEPDGTFGGGGNTGRFRYPEISDILKDDQLTANVIDSLGTMSINAVGRHHPGKSEGGYGGTANFVFVDGHVERSTVLKTIKERKWGDRVHSLSGKGLGVDLN